MRGLDNNKESKEHRSTGWDAFWEYSLIVAGLAVVITFGTYSISRNVKDSYAQATIDKMIDRTTTASIPSRKPAQPATGSETTPAVPR